MPRKLKLRKGCWWSLESTGQWRMLPSTRSYGIWLWAQLEPQGEWVTHLRISGIAKFHVPSRSEQLVAFPNLKHEGQLTWVLTRTVYTCQLKRVAKCLSCPTTDFWKENFTHCLVNENCDVHGINEWQLIDCLIKRLHIIKQILASRLLFDWSPLPFMKQETLNLGERC